MQAILLALLLSAAEPATPGPQVDLQFGIAAFNRDLATRLKLGPAWCLSGQLPLREGLWLMLGYEGAAIRVRAPEVSGNSVSNGGFAALRLGLAEQALLRPYAFVGMGLLHSDVAQGARGAFQSDLAGIVPAGAGLEGSLPGGFVLGVRFTYNLVFDNELEAGAGSSTSDLWLASLGGAYRF